MDEADQARLIREQRAKSERRTGRGCLVWSLLGIIFLLYLVYLGLGPIGPSIKAGPHSSRMQQARQIGIALLGYATDHGGHYPDGASSTAVFQLLLDHGYANDSTLFYVPMDGKRKPDTHQKKLEPANVCFDVTGGADTNDSDFLPLVFLTGYRITFAPGWSAGPVMKPYPPYLGSNSWFAHRDSDPGIAVFYKGNNAMWLRAQADAAGAYAIPNFVRPDYIPNGKTYRQLTPDGVLPPK